MKLRRGFTLVELLIVIVIIGILAAAMMLSSGSATASARAAVIISDMRSIKTAVLMYWADHMESSDSEIMETLADESKGGVTNLAKYMDNPEKYTLNNGWRIQKGTGAAENKWFVRYALNVGGVSTEVRQKLAGKAASVGFWDSNEASYVYGSYNNDLGDELYMYAR